MNIYVRFYDYMADIIRFLEDHTDKGFYERYRGMNPLSVMRMNQKLGERFPELVREDSGQTLEIMDDERWNDDFFARFDSFIIDGKRGAEDKRLLVRLLHKLDTGLSERVLSGTDCAAGSCGINCLNTNYEKTGIILLPRRRCLWERNSRGRQYGTGLMNDIKSVYYIKEEDLGQYKLTNIFLPVTFLQGKRSVKIGMSPITNKDVLKISYQEREDVVYFAIDGLHKERGIRNNVKCIIKRAKNEDVNLLVFPEMLGVDGLQEDCRQLYEENWEADGPEMIVFPSIWREYTNTSVITRADASEIGRQQKQNPYQRYVEKYGAEAIEDLKPDRRIVLLHAEGAGRIAVVICKDFLTRDYRRMILDCLKATLIIVPSYSTGSFDFMQAMGECQQYDCGVLWLNCCGAMHLENAKKDNFRDIGYVQFSGKLTDSVGRVPVEEQNRCGKERCKKDCLFIREVPLPM